MWSKVLGMLEEADAIGPAFSLCCPRHQGTNMLASQPKDFKFKAQKGDAEKCVTGKNQYAFLFLHHVLPNVDLKREALLTRIGL
jgi:hypothetical protein